MLVASFKLFNVLGIYAPTDTYALPAKAQSNQDFWALVEAAVRDLVVEKKVLIVAGDCNAGHEVQKKGINSNLRNLATIANRYNLRFIRTGKTWRHYSGALRSLDRVSIRGGYCASKSTTFDHGIVHRPCAGNTLCEDDVAASLLDGLDLELRTTIRGKCCL